MRVAIKSVLLYLTKYLGGFAVARWITRRQLRVLCYHGISVSDEHLFRRKLFVRPETFRRRMESLVRDGYVVLSLDEALERLRNGTLCAGSVVITLDDGWRGILTGAFPVLQELGLKATLYLTTYYVERQLPVFDVLIGYILWRTDASRLQLDGLVPGLQGELDLSTQAARQEASRHIVEYGNRSHDSRERCDLTEKLAERLHVDLKAIRLERRFHLVSLQDVKSLSAAGIDIQLHTHRHRLDLENQKEFEREIRQNRDSLEPTVGRRLEHFCYPSGIYHPRVWPWLEELGLQSATITSTGFCYRNSPRYALPRIVDGEDVPHVEFEAEMAGALELIRRTRRWIFGRSEGEM